MSDEKLKVLLTESQINEKIAELGAKITKDYAGKEIIMIGVIKGALPFFLSLARQIKVPQRWDFLAVSSYGNRRESSGVVKINMDLGLSIVNQHVLIVEDIIDTGLTMEYLIKNFKTRQPASIKICSLLLKKENLKRKLNVDYHGFDIPKKFVVGFGLDNVETMRELPYIGYIEE